MSALPALVLFTFFYGVYSNWRAHRVGRALFWFAVSLLTVLTLFTLTVALGDWLGREYVRIVAYGFVSFTIWRMFIELRRIQKSQEDS